MEPLLAGVLFVVVALVAVPLIILVIARLFGKTAVFRLRDFWSPIRRAFALGGLALMGVGISLVVYSQSGTEIDRSFGLVYGVLVVVGAGVVVWNLPRPRRAASEARRESLLIAPAVACPECGSEMRAAPHGDVTVDVCQGCESIWFDLGEIGESPINPSTTTGRGAVDDSAFRNLSAIEGARCPRCPETRLRIGSFSGFAFQRCLRCGGFLLSSQAVAGFDTGDLPKSRSDARPAAEAQPGDVLDRLIRSLLGEG